ncbi:hypothetical protein LBMAG21_09390 [Armatimonadota bacterium]|nr:hypothetical protein LBMAG21_09390 [Armatimonadota bacterium]
MGTVSYTVFDGEVTSEYRNGVLKSYVVDPLGSTIALIDNTQTILVLGVRGGGEPHRDDSDSVLVWSL